MDISSYARSKVATTTLNTTNTSRSVFKEIAPADCTDAISYLLVEMRMIQNTIFDLAVSNSMGKRSASARCTTVNFVAFSTDIAQFFEPAIKNIIKAMEEQTRKTTNIKVRSNELGFCITHNLAYRLSLWSEDLLPLITCFPNCKIISS